jgi:exopolyphosphatase/guanosine-5'-triphosphate,3'-diphosphate pyrophosphatase
MKYSFLLVLFLVGNVFANECEVTRAAFDIGSGSTKMKVAVVDKCKQQIVELLMEAQEKVSYKEALKLSANNSLDQEILAKGSQALNRLKLQAQIYNPEIYIGSATSAFRTAINGEFAKKILETKTGIDIKIISQEVEAKIGFVAASTIASPVSLDNLVVWDIGGGSMQITTLDENGDFDIYKGKVASVSFKNHIIEQVQYNNVEEINTPNPISTADYNLARRDAFAIASLTTSRVLRDKLKKDNTVVVGIGGVHFYSILSNVTDKGYYTRDDLTERLAQTLGKTDDEVGGEYASTDVSNLVLVKGFMDALYIDMINVGNVNLATGLLLAPDLIN